MAHPEFGKWGAAIGGVGAKPELESRPKFSGPRRDYDTTRPRRDRDLEQKVETRPRLERAETRHETFGIKGSQKVVNILPQIYNTPTNFLIRQNVASHTNCLMETQKNCNCRPSGLP